MKNLFCRASYILVATSLAVSLYLYATEWSELATIGSFTLHITDLLFAAACVCTLAGAILVPRPHSTPERALLALCGLLVLSFFRGIFAVGPAAAGVPFREFADFIGLAGVMFFWGREFELQRLFRLIVGLGWGIVALSAIRLAHGFDTFVRAPADQFAEVRMLDGAAALMLGLAALIALNAALSQRPGRARLRAWMTVAIFACCVLASQQRTASFAMLTGVAVVLAALPRRQRGSLLLAVCIGAPLVSTGLILWSGFGRDLTDLLPRAAVMITHEQGTFAWRLLQWADYQRAYEQASVLDRLVGQPFGFLRHSVGQDSLLFIEAHNGYIQLLMSSGLIGLVLFGVVLLGAIRNGLVLRKVRFSGITSAETSGNRPSARRGQPGGPQTRSDPATIRLGMAIVAAQAVFSIGYALPNEQGLVLALALQLVNPAGWFIRRSQLPQLAPGDATVRRDRSLAVDRASGLA